MHPLLALIWLAQTLHNETIFLLNQSDLTGSERIKRYSGGTVILVSKITFKIGTVISISKLIKWNSFISSDQRSGTVIFVPIRRVEQFYLFRFKKGEKFYLFQLKWWKSLFRLEKWNSYICSNRFWMKQLYLFQQTAGETVLFNPTL